jgi:hypothetical protein
VPSISNVKGGVPLSRSLSAVASMLRSRSMARRFSNHAWSSRKRRSWSEAAPLVGLRDGVAIAEHLVEQLPLGAGPARDPLAQLPVESPEVGLDLAARTGRTYESVRLIATGKRGLGGFPAHCREVSGRCTPGQRCRSG